MEGAAAGGKFDRQRTAQILAGLSQRIFYLHNVHEDEPVIFSTRWTLSYLAGPMTREQISLLPDNHGTAQTIDSVSYNSAPKQNIENLNSASPVLPPQVQQVYLPVRTVNVENIVYMPSVIGVADVFYNSTKYGVSACKKYTLVAPLKQGLVALDWNDAKHIDIDLRDLDNEPLDGATFADCPASAANAKSYDNWRKLFAQHIRTNLKLKLLYNPKIKIVSEPGEEERDFRVRLQHLVHEKRDDALEALKKKYDSKINTLEERRRRAQQEIDRQNAMANQRKMEAAVSAGTAILGALFGRKSISATSISRVGTAVKSTGRALKSHQGISQAQETLESVEAQLEELQIELEQQIEKISNDYDMIMETLEEVEIGASSGDINVHLLCLAWNPYKKDSNGFLTEA